MKRISRINTDDQGFANRPKNSDAFFFSDDIAKWMPRIKPERKDRRKKHVGGRIDKNSWG